MNQEYTRVAKWIATELVAKYAEARRRPPRRIPGDTPWFDRNEVTLDDVRDMPAEKGTELDAFVAKLDSRTRPAAPDIELPGHRAPDVAAWHGQAVEALLAAAREHFGYKLGTDAAVRQTVTQDLANLAGIHVRHAVATGMNPNMATREVERDLAIAGLTAASVAS